MYDVILFKQPNPSMTQEMINLYIKKANINPCFDVERTTQKLKALDFLRHDKTMVEVIQELNCSDYEIVTLTDEDWRYYSISPDEKIILNNK